MVDSRHFAFATGSARMSSEEMSRWRKAPPSRPDGRTYRSEYVPRTEVQDWEMVIRANSPVMERRIWDAVKFIRETVAEFKVPAVVSFSGGKDSLATMLLTRDAGLDLPSFFIDTGLEFPETVQYVERDGKRYHLKLIVEHAPEHAFFGNLAISGRRKGFPLVLQDEQARSDREGDHGTFPGRRSVVHRPAEIRIRTEG